VLEAGRIGEARSINIGAYAYRALINFIVPTEDRINNNKTKVKEMSYFFRTLRNPE
jgi:hypothetical protein